MTPLHFDTAALQEPFDAEKAHAEADAWVRKIAGESGRAATRTQIVFRFIVLVVGAGVLAGLFVVMAQLIFGGVGANIFTWVIAAIMVVPIAVGFIRAQIRSRRDEEERWFRLSRFANANALEYTPYQEDPPLPPSVFQRGGSRAIRDGLASRAEGVQIANYGYERTAARTRMQHTACFLAFDAPATLPPMTMVTRLGDVWGQPSVPPADQREIEGVLGDRFHLYGAPGDEERIRQALTADVSDALWQVASHCDLEVVGGRIYVIARRELTLTSLAFWRWAEDLAVVVRSVLLGSAAVDEATRTGWQQRSEERNAMFAAPPSGKTFLIGCLLPAVFGVAAAALTAQFSF
ncbi:hypothetical protein ACFVAE_08695 [Microbacterium sp. NPDC057659]|uniref:hypothetical protein n=1 Tax=Microbacterium sp. NPDC057659 TaxID=3346198 RepID=UPI00366EDEAB